MGKVTDFLFPRERIFIKMLEDAAKNSLKGTEVFGEFMKEFSQLTKDQKKDYLKTIGEIEDRGDRIIHVIHDKLNSSFITPIDKEDIHELAGILDDIIDLLYSATKQIVLYDLKSADTCIQDLTRIIVDGTKEVQFVVASLEKGNFSKEHSMRIHQLENEADEIYQKAMAELYRGKISAVELIKIKDIYFNLELVTDKIEDVSDVVQSILIKNG